jgi:hypothetical protein
VWNDLSEIVRYPMPSPRGWWKISFVAVSVCVTGGSVQERFTANNIICKFFEDSQSMPLRSDPIRSLATRITIYSKCLISNPRSQVFRIIQKCRAFCKKVRIEQQGLKSKSSCRRASIQNLSQMMISQIGVLTRGVS